MVLAFVFSVVSCAILLLIQAGTPIKMQRESGLVLKTVTMPAVKLPFSSDTHDSQPAAPGKRYLALGDSYTIGQSVAPDQNFPSQLVTRLRAAGISLQDPEIIAVTGWTTRDLGNAIGIRKPKGPYDAVTLLIGVNDQYQGLDILGYREGFTRLLNSAIRLTGNRPSRVFVLSVPDYSVTPFANTLDTGSIREQLDLFNSINKAITLFLHATYIDLTQLTREMKINPELVAGDGLHPSAMEYRYWTDLLEPQMAVALRQVP